MVHVRVDDRLYLHGSTVNHMLTALGGGIDGLRSR